MSEEVDDLKERIDELEQELEEALEVSDRFQEGLDEGHDNAMREIESTIEKVFYGGHAAGVKNEPALRALLNFKMEERL